MTSLESSRRSRSVVTLAVPTTNKRTRSVATRQSRPVHLRLKSDPRQRKDKVQQHRGGGRRTNPSSVFTNFVGLFLTFLGQWRQHGDSPSRRIAFERPRTTTEGSRSSGGGFNVLFSAFCCSGFFYCVVGVALLLLSRKRGSITCFSSSLSSFCCVLAGRKLSLLPPSDMVTEDAFSSSDMMDWW